MTSFQVRSGKLDEFLAWYPEVVTSLMQGSFSSDMKRVYALTDAEKVMAVVIYEDKAATDRVQGSNDYKQALSSGAHLIDFDTIVREGGYEVSLQI